MKTTTVNVMVMIQMDVNAERIHADVITGLDGINDILQKYPDESFHGQIFVTDISSSDITEVDIDWETGDHAVCPEPEGNDQWNFGGWVGTIIDIKEDTDGEWYAELQDCEGDVWCVALHRLTKEED